VPALVHNAHSLASIAEADVSDVDCAVICTNHSAFDYGAIVQRFGLIVDTRNALRAYDDPRIFRL
jgi:UDP-N-acetyl-D-glucosamine dehydrogenase